MFTVIWISKYLSKADEKNVILSSNSLQTSSVQREREVKNTRDTSSLLLGGTRDVMSRHNAKWTDSECINKIRILPSTSRQMLGKNPSSSRRPARQVCICEDKNHEMQIQTNVKHLWFRDNQKQNHRVRVCVCVCKASTMTETRPALCVRFCVFSSSRTGRQKVSALGEMPRLWPNTNNDTKLVKPASVDTKQSREGQRNQLSFTDFQLNDDRLSLW